MKTVGVVLAAGAGRRFGGPKALASTDGQRWVDRAVRTLHAAGIADVLVISGAWDGSVPGAQVINNPEWRSGMASSLRLALENALVSAADQVLITLVDLPDLTSSQVRAVLDCPAPLVQARYEGVPGHPVKVSAPHLDALKRSLFGDVGARPYLLANGVVEIDLPGDLRDRDHPPLR